MFAVDVAVLERLEEAVDAVCTTDAAVDLPRLRRALDRLTAGWVRAVGRADADGLLAHERTGPAGVLAQWCDMPYGAARGDLTAARALRRLPAIAAALTAGEIGPDHARVVTRACTPSRIDAFAAADEAIAAAARHCSPRDLHGIVTRLCDAVDGDGGARGARELFDERRLHLSASLYGAGFLDGRLDPEGTASVGCALEFRMSADRPQTGDDPRTRQQRRADALVDICRFYLAHHDAPPARHRGRPQVGVVVDLEVLRRDGHRDLAAAVRGDLEHAGAVAAETLRRLTCDASVHRILTDGPSEVLDVGRSTRTVPPALWRALVARDGHCRHPGCRRPPGWCEAHHVRHWADGGPTTLDNLELLCWWHHRSRHEGCPRPSTRAHAGGTIGSWRKRSSSTVMRT
jgi:hypothetical protein